MTDKQKKYKQSLIQKAQILKKNRFKSDEIRKDWLIANYGVDSFKLLSIDQLNSVIDFLNGCEHKLVNCSNNQSSKIESLWNEKARDKSYKALISFVHNIVKKRPLYIKSLSTQDAQKVIIALENLKG